MTLRAARLAAHLTQAELAKRAGVSLRTVHSAEYGRRIRMEVRRKLLLALEIDFKCHREIFGALPGQKQ